MRIPWAGVFHRLGQSETNTYLIPSCLIGYQIGTHVGAYCIRPLIIPERDIQSRVRQLWGVCNTPLPCRQKNRISRVGGGLCLGQRETNMYFNSPCLIGYQMGIRVGAQKNTPFARLSSTPAPLAGRLVGRMQYAPTLSEKDEVSLGMRFPLSRTMADKSVFHFSMSNRLSDRCPGRGVLHTPPARLSSTLSPFAGRLVGRMQYVPTLSKKEEVSSDRCFPLSRTRRDKSVFHFSMSNRLSDRYPCRGVLNTPPARLSSTHSPLAGRLVGRMQYAPTLSKKDEGSSGRCFLLSRTIRDEYVFHFFMSNRLSDRYPGRGVLNTPLARLSSTLSPLAGRIGGVCNTPLPCRQKNRISRVGGGLCFEKKERNPHFFSPCLIGYQIDTRVGAY